MQYVKIQRPLTKERAILLYKTWDQEGRTTPPTPAILTGHFYSRYKDRFKLFPYTDIKHDLQNMTQFLSTMDEASDLAPWVIDAMFNLKDFRNLRTDSLCNPNVINNWNMHQRAEKLRSGQGFGEQSEFKSDRKGWGSTRV
jgi:hypothetical protein